MTSIKTLLSFAVSSLGCRMLCTVATETPSIFATHLPISVQSAPPGPTSTMRAGFHFISRVTMSENRTVPTMCLYQYSASITSSPNHVPVTLDVSGISAFRCSTVRAKSCNRAAASFIIGEWNPRFT